MRKPRSANRNGSGGSAESRSLDAGSPPANRPVQHGPGLIVGLGASAGGLEAFRSFFEAMPADSGMAFVLVQHLDPDYPSALTEIVKEFTSMAVVRATEGTLVAANTVSVIPPNSILKIEDGILRVARPESLTARRSSVDIFLASLARDQGERAVGIILSGFGSDGTIGIGAIKEAGGLTLSEATFDHQAKAGMPQSAAAGGFVDNVLQPQEMPERLLEHLRFRAGVEHEYEAADVKAEGRIDHLTTICAVLHSRLGRDFGQYKRSTLLRRVHRRMQALRIVDTDAYIDQLRKLPNEPDLLFREILIGVTRFFRDPQTFDTLAETVVPQLLASGDPREPVRVWVAGCATGEEAYSLAILFREAAEAAESSRQITIFATDLDDRAVKFARSGVYTDAIEADVTAARLERRFVKEGQRYRITRSIRDMCVFSAHDLVKDPAFSKLNMISCRNLLIYFEPPLQQRVISAFHYGLKPDGVLWLGPSETISANAKLFCPVDKRGRIFRRLPAVVQTPKLPGGKTSRRARQAEPQIVDALDDQAARIISQLTPAYLVIDGQNDIQRFSGPVAKFLDPVTGSASFNLFRMLHADLRGPCRTLVRRVLDGEGHAQELATFAAGGVTEAVNVIAQAMTEATGGQQFLLLAFQELPHAIQGRLSAAALGEDSSSDDELIATRERLQTISEELETANEELQSSNEEFQSVNEELHSTVEELETSKEELQSINEELQTVNAELSNRAESLVRSNSDLANLFDSTSIATLFLDSQLRIRRFTPSATGLFNLRPGDEGRPLTDIASRLADHDLTRDVETVLRDLGMIEREIDSEDGVSTHLLRVRPYRDLDNVIDGVVLTLVDISERKHLDRDRARLAAIVEFSEDAIMSHDLAGSITSWNTGAEKVFGYPPEEVLGQPMSILLGEGQADQWPATLARLRAGAVISSLDVSRVTDSGHQIHVSMTISPIRDVEGVIVGASAVARDISDRKAAEERAGLLLAELDHRVKNILSVVSAVVTQTLKSGAPLDVAKGEIEGRIMAIARAHGLLTGHGGVEGSLLELLTTELAPYDRKGNLAIRGDQVVLTSKSSLILALAIHELATNAAKYGALSATDGSVTVEWHVAEDTTGRTLQLDWTEIGGPPVKEPSRRGFGTRLIEQSLVRGLSASVERQFLPSGVRCRIRLPFHEDVGRVSEVAVAAPPP